MIVRILRSLADPQPLVVNAGLVLVEGSQGQPVVVAADLGGGAIAAEVARPDTEVEFNRLLRTLGVNKSVIVEDLGKSLASPANLPKIAGA